MATGTAIPTATAELADEMREAVSSRINHHDRQPTANLIGICGRKRSGKDTVAEAFCGDGWSKVGFADALKHAALRIDPVVGFRTVTIKSFPATDETVPVRLSELIESIGWEEAKKTPEVRRFLQRYGTEGGRDVFGQDCWVEITRQKIEAGLVVAAGVVVPDVRFQNERDLIHELGGVVFEVRREDGHREHYGTELTTSENEWHVSEKVPFSADYVLYNAGTIQDLQVVSLKIWRTLARRRLVNDLD